MLKIKEEIPAMKFVDGRDAFRPPRFYGLVSKSHSKYSYDCYLVPFNYLMKAKRWFDRWLQKGKER